MKLLVSSVSIHILYDGCLIEVGCWNVNVRSDALMGVVNTSAVSAVNSDIRKEAVGLNDE